MHWTAVRFPRRGVGVLLVPRRGVGVLLVPRRGVGVLLVAALLGACSSPGPPDAEPLATRTVITSTSDGDRSAIVHHPARARRGAPLVVVLHGSSGSGQAMQAELGWDALAEREGVVVAYPDGIGHAWNAGRCCGRASTSSVDDVRFLDALRAQLVQTDGIDPTRVYAVGFSNGAMMTYTWACGRPGTLAGIGAVAGSLVAACPAPAPITVVAVTGTSDRNVPIEGRPDRGWPGLDDSIAPFRAAAGCPAQPAVSTTGGAEIRSWTCAGGRTVTREVIAGVAHAWPGGGSGAGTTLQPTDATGYLWSLLRPAHT
ncbi:alpha/beta hydrolase family esterase [Pseudonocardia sp. GCM10023141]|uniref:alpha/beta hydrolase family esterase n=1 Tax=Pseudonocardia sp. GCM10023141 TaxID=3252653 RepID=UPI00360AC9E1